MEESGGEIEGHTADIHLLCGLHLCVSGCNVLVGRGHEVHPNAAVHEDEHAQRESHPSQLDCDSLRNLQGKIQSKCKEGRGGEEGDDREERRHRGREVEGRGIREGGRQRGVRKQRERKGGGGERDKKGRKAEGEGKERERDRKGGRRKRGRREGGRWRGTRTKQKAEHAYIIDVAYIFGLADNHCWSKSSKWLDNLERYSGISTCTCI